jgi:hypothetical protein
VPSSGTSIVALMLLCSRLHCHVSAANRPRLATSARTSNCGASRRGRASFRILSRNPCIGSRLFAEPVAASRATASSSNYVGRTLWTPSGFSVVWICWRRRLWRDHPSGDENINVTDIPR